MPSNRPPDPSDEERLILSLFKLSASEQSRAFEILGEDPKNLYRFAKRVPELKRIMEIFNLPPTFRGFEAIMQVSPGTLYYFSGAGSSPDKVRRNCPALCRNFNIEPSLETLAKYVSLIEPETLLQMMNDMEPVNPPIRKALWDKYPKLHDIWINLSGLSPRVRRETWEQKIKDILSPEEYNIALQAAEREQYNRILEPENYVRNIDIKCQLLGMKKTPEAFLVMGNMSHMVHHWFKADNSSAIREIVSANPRRTMREFIQKLSNMCHHIQQHYCTARSADKRHSLQVRADQGKYGYQADQEDRVNARALVIRYFGNYGLSESHTQLVQRFAEDCITYVLDGRYPPEPYISHAPQRVAACTIIGNELK